MKTKLVLLLPILSMCFCNAFSQMGDYEKQLDSLYKELDKIDIADSNRLTILTQIGQYGWIMRYGYWDTIIKESEKILNSSQSKTNRAVKICKATAYNNLGYIYDDRGESDSALNYYRMALDLQVAVNDKEGMATSYDNMGFLYQSQGNVPLALEYMHKALKIDEEIGDEYGMGHSYNNIGLTHYHQGDYEAALEFYDKAKNIQERLGDLQGLGYAYNNIGGVYRKQGKTQMALEHFKKALEIQEESGDIYGKSYSLDNIGTMEHKLGNYEDALSNYQRALVIQEEMQDKKGKITSLVNIGKVKLDQGELSVANTNANEALVMAQELGFTDNISRSAELCFQVAKKLGDWQKALEMHELHIVYRDSMMNENNQKEAIRLQTKHEFEKAQLVEEQQRNEELRIMNEELSRRNNLQYSLIFLGVIVLFSLLFALGKFSISPLFAEGLIFFAFLILFEFLLVLGDPYIEDLTGGEPIYKLLANAALAGLIFPAHAFFERALKARIVKK